MPHTRSESIGLRAAKDSLGRSQCCADQPDVIISASSPRRDLGSRHAVGRATGPGRWQRWADEIHGVGEYLRRVR
ncbi:hypothetical protein [Wenjunlia tyrosinilytica]|jgi:hypothetical protein|uniref:Uncharacterized protein n=1 Tax=Wenjunlia tyrosinilytica TaxID=1544741 RepID=A0A918E146_9ACTN|nr:hypothetical protein [Wenjunlia tyrosinilytica]GGO96633.1 hypothetical protein GCM10012280_56580 [Wenjunlia tyrosinilytica]